MIDQSLRYTGKDRLHHACSKIRSSAKQQNPEERLTRPVVILFMQHSPLLMNLLSKS